jgi:hypothetical protein
MNFGIVLSVTFKTFPAPTYSIRNWVLPSSTAEDAWARLIDFQTYVAKLDWNCSADAYLYHDDGNLQVGVAMIETSTPGSGITSPEETPWGSPGKTTIVDGVELFDTEMYVSEMHGGHAGGATSAFKRCVFLNSVGSREVAGRLLQAILSRPSPRCYLHLLHGGGAVETSPQMPLLSGVATGSSRALSPASGLVMTVTTAKSHDPSRRGCTESLKACCGAGERMVRTSDRIHETCPWPRRPSGRTFSG